MRRSAQEFPDAIPTGTRAKADSPTIRAKLQAKAIPLDLRRPTVVPLGERSTAGEHGHAEARHLLS